MTDGKSERVRGTDKNHDGVFLDARYRLPEIGRRRFELVVKVNKNSVPVSLNDVGFGISQFLPIIVADLQLGKNSTLLVAQPEIHLHPSVQAQLGNYMCRQIKESNKNYIVETHSEYLLNRVRLAIVKGEIPQDDVKIYYLDNDGEDVQT
ncbi:MAG: AAA family ATPase, partial [bacterium]|nr:AAA family ATPase [bacterium]